MLETMFDITFISYNEINADANWERLKSRFPFARRIHGITGIHNAHIVAANKCFTKMFWVVDGDSEINDEFNFSDPFGVWDESVYVYKAVNPINGLTYGNGGVKLLPTNATKMLNVNSVDMTTSIVEHFTAVDQIASITRFNTTPFNTWKSAFRECVKLSSKVINGQISNETDQRLETWCTIGVEQPFGEYAIAGAIAGREFGIANMENSSQLILVNNFSWLLNEFDRKYNV